MMSWIFGLPILQQQQRLLLWTALIYGCLLTSYTITGTSNEFNNQIMPRVIKKIDTFLQKAVNILSDIKSYRDLDMFEYGLTIADHTRLSPLMYSSVTAHHDWWIALEDGTVFYPYEPPIHGMQIREPGQNGYKVKDAKRENHPYHKHLISCINETNGEPKDCIADVGVLYVECINDCELLPCSNTSTNDSSSSNNNTDDYNNTSNGNTNNTSNATSNDILSLLPKWCPNYVVKEVQPDEEGLLGYVPFTFFCINVNGQPEQRPGYVLTDSNTLGNCYYQDGITMVNRTLSGQYAFCGPNKTCNNAFAGGADSSDPYDARIRPWYIEAKLAQQASWSEPFVAYGDNTIGIQYTVPLYNYKNMETGSIQASLLNEIANSSIVDDISLQYRQVFAGLLVGGTDLGNLTKFLVDEYANTTMRVFIVEQSPNVNGTNYMIASSTGNNVKRLLLSNRSQPCPEESLRDPKLCTIERLSVQELRGVGGDGSISTADDVIFYRAFIEFEQLNFPTTGHVNFRVNPDDVYSHTYVGQLQTYQQPNLDWRIFVILPMDRSSNDAITAGDPSFPLVCIIATLGLVGGILLLIIFYQKRPEDTVINANWILTCAFIFGCAVLNLSTFLMLGENTNSLCMLRMWSFNALFISALSPLFVKVWRMSKLLNASAGFERMNISNFQSFLYTLPFIVVEVIILVIYSFLDPPRQTEQLGVGVGIGVQQITCQQSTNTFFITQVSYCAVLLFIGCIMAYSTIDEARQLGFSMYNITFTSIVAVLIMKLVNLDRVSQIILQAVCVLWGSFFCSLAFVLPRFLEESKKKTHKTSSAPSSSGFLRISESTPSCMIAFKQENTSKPNDDATSQRESLNHPVIVEETLLNNDSNTSITKSFPKLDTNDNGSRIDDDLDEASKSLNDHHVDGTITSSHDERESTISAAHNDNNETIKSTTNYLTGVTESIDRMGLLTSSLRSHDDIVQTASIDTRITDT